MGREPSTYVTAGLVALALIGGLHGRAYAQQTDGRVLIGAGIEPLTIAWTKTRLDSFPPSTTTTRLHMGPSGEILLAVGYGLGAWVLALDVAFGRTSETSEQIDIRLADAETEYTITRTFLAVGPSARLLFGEGSVRPFVEAGVGLEIDNRSSGGGSGDSLALYARVGPGLQLELADAVSLDLSLRLGYAAASGTYDPDVRIIEVSSGGITEIAPSDFTSRTLDLAMTARLSIWL